ncbi:MAG: thiamine pyrophosphate-binding protein [Enterocloster clostridioformis]
MKMKISNYIAGKLVEEGISQAFMVTGGGAMHLDDGLGHQEGLHCIYNHHEQACAMAAEAYARIHNRIAALCVTTGPGGTNAITGVVGGWLDSIPMLVLSGQVRYDTTARWSGVGIRAMGDQEFDICKAVDCMTKVFRDGHRSHADPLLSGEGPLSGPVRASGPLLAGYSPECPGRICGDRGASRL